MTEPVSPDQSTADAFDGSWNHLSAGSVYSELQFNDWLAPLMRDDVAGRRVLELGCGGGSLLLHMARWAPRELVGVDLGTSSATASKNLSRAGVRSFRVVRHDLVTFRAEQPFDLVYCIGVLHHLKDPRAGFDAVLANTAAGARFHCWVYAHEGNAVVRWVADPLRRIASRLPWWFTKYAIAMPLVVPFYLYARLLAAMRWPVLQRLPLYEYSLWITQRDFGFFRHVAFDQLVTPQTVYISRATVEEWLNSAEVEPDSGYIVFRNGNSWKFGGRRRR